MAPSTHLSTRATTDRERLERRRRALLSRSGRAVANAGIEVLELGSEQYRVRFLSQLTEPEQRELSSVIAALCRLADGTFGACATCGDPVERAYLEANPDAARCLRCVELAARRRA